MASGAFWASWADALHMLHERLPQLAVTTVERLDGVHDVGGCLKELRRAADGLDRQGFVGRPSWVDLQSGGRHHHPVEYTFIQKRFHPLTLSLRGYQGSGDVYANSLLHT